MKRNLSAVTLIVASCYACSDVASELSPVEQTAAQASSEVVPAVPVTQPSAVMPPISDPIVTPGNSSAAPQPPEVSPVIPAEPEPAPVSPVAMSSATMSSAPVSPVAMSSATTSSATTSSATMQAEPQQEPPVKEPLAPSESEPSPERMPAERMPSEQVAPIAPEEPALVLEGPAPERRTFSSNEDFELLEHDEMHTEFERERNRLQVHPLRDNNWPADFDWRNAPGKDDELNERHMFARAQLEVALKTWYYDITIEGCAESDGESPFKLVVGDWESEVWQPEPDDSSTTCAQKSHTWRKVAIRADQRLQVQGKPHSNKKLTEAGNGRRFSPTFAWARARWLSITVAPTPNVP